MLKPTSFRTVLIGGGLGAVVGYFITRLLVTGGQPMFVPSYTFALVCIVLVPIEIVLAFRVWRSSHGKNSVPINPLFAFRVLVLAKSYIFTGVFFCGFCLGVGLHLLLNGATPSPEITYALLISFMAAFVLWLGGLISEWLCRLPKNDKDVSSCVSEG